MSYPVNDDYQGVVQRGLDDPATIMSRLQMIDSDLAAQRNEIASAARRYYRKKRDFELRLAQEYLEAEGSNQKERESKALVELSSEPMYEEFIVAEAAYHARLKVIHVLETRATIGQSLLKTHAQEAKYG